MAARVKLERWGAHMLLAREREIALAQYAREHGLSRHTLYAAQRQLREQTGHPTPPPPSRAKRAARASPFVAIETAPRTGALHVQLPNGVEIEFTLLDAAAYTQVLGLLLAAPCSN